MNENSNEKYMKDEPDLPPSKVWEEQADWIAAKIRDAAPQPPPPPTYDDINEIKKMLDRINGVDGITEAAVRDRRDERLWNTASTIGSFYRQTYPEITQGQVDQFRRRRLQLIPQDRYTETVAGMMAEMAGLLVGEPDIEKASEILRTLQEVHARRYGEEVERPDPDVRCTPGDADPYPLMMDPH